MILDFNEVENGVNITADICIIGAGAAGITIARSLIGTGLKVCLVESGGLEANAETQALYTGEDIGRPDRFTLDVSRLRFFGGTTNHWGGWCGPLDELDFTARDWVPFSGWPITRRDLDPYYARAHEICLLDDYTYDPDKLGLPDTPLPKFHIDKLTTRFWRYSEPALFNRHYQDELKNADELTVYLNANLLELTLAKNGNGISQALLSSLSGRRATVSAKIFVLACGGIENARLLLLQNKQRQHGLCNENDLVGRFYITHFHIVSAQIIANDPERLGVIFSRYRKNGTHVRPAVCLSEKAQVEHKVLNFGVSIERALDPDSGFLALRDIREELSEGEWPEDFPEKLWTVISDLPDTVGDLYDHFAGNPYRGKVNRIDVTSHGEQAPNRDSRILLSDKRDIFGQRKVQRNWQITGLDEQTIRIGHKFLGEELGRLNLGRLQLHDWLLEENAAIPDEATSFAHHIGTTRMSDDPRQGVVNADCRAHSVSNLYIAGSSVYPTAGFMNPTLTIVALAIRLADHLKNRFA